MADYVSAIQNGDTKGTPSSVNVIVNGKNETWNMKNDHVELLQFTGLKDANGKEIYEGDIVRVSFDGESYADEVVWWGKDGQDSCYPAFDLKKHSADYDQNAFSGIIAYGAETIEVIGNMHENPELLEAQYD